MRNPRRKKHSAAAVTMSVATPKLSDRLPMTFIVPISTRLSSLNLQRIRQDPCRCGYRLRRSRLDGVHCFARVR